MGLAGREAVLPPVMVMDWPAARVVSWFRLILVALVVPMFRATAVAVSTSGVRMEVSARPVPDIQELAV